VRLRPSRRAERTNKNGLSFLTIGQQFLGSDEYYNRAAAQ
jgi:hypothetical protein